LSYVLTTRWNCLSFFRFSSTAAINISSSLVKFYILCWTFFRSKLILWMIWISTSSSYW
jgi:hypothetical protein